MPKPCSVHHFIHSSVHASVLAALALSLSGCIIDLGPPGSTGQPSPSATATAQPTSQPTSLPSPEPTPIPPQSPTPAPSDTPATQITPPPLEAGQLLYLNMNTVPDASVYPGASLGKNISAVSDGKYGGAWHFSGTSSYVKIPLDINPAVYPKLTMTAWARYTGPASAGPMQVISHDNGGYDRSLGIDSRGGGGRSWSCFAGSAGVVGSKQPLVNNEWVFLAVTYDQANKTTMLYVNGELSMKSLPSVAADGLPFLYIGANPSYGEYFTGDLDEVRVYGQVLTRDQIQAIGYWTGYKQEG